MWVPWIIVSTFFFQKKFTGPCLSLWIPKSGTFKICEILLVFSAVLFGLAYANIFQAPTWSQTFMWNLVKLSVELSFGLNYSTQLNVHFTETILP